MKLIHQIGHFTGKTADHVIGWLLVISVLINITQVFTRYVMNAPLFWTDEMIRYTTVWLTFVGASAASLYGDHMDMNLFLGVQNKRFQAWHQAFLHTLILGFSILIAWEGGRFCLLNGMQTAPATGLPMLAVYGAIFLGGIMLALVSIHKIVASITGKGHLEAPAP